jgi:hypothetical protein
MNDPLKGSPIHSSEQYSHGENLDIEWGENHEELIFEQVSRSDSQRHICKGRRCDTTFDKL